jgi:hypothetical protein
MSGRRLFGVETEYAVAAIGRNGTVWPTPHFNEELLLRARRRLAHLPGMEGGLFLSNGSRLYVDYGNHPEIGSPECLDPWDAIRYSKAGDRILVQLADDVQRDYPEIAETVIRTGNVDYSGLRSTWGSHESYCHRAEPALVQRHLVPHLVSRIVYAGAGGFNPFSHGLEFMLAPRAQHITCVTSLESTGNRGIVNTREEPLAAQGYQRQHLLCGERLRSDVATFLRIGTTALVVAMIEANVACGGEVALAHPLEALALIARDTEGRRSVATAAGHLTAVQIQRWYLNRALEHLKAPWMPAWAREVCARWDEMLTRVEQGPEACCRSLDWAIKLAIFRDRARRRGFDWDLLPVWTRIADIVEPARLATKAPEDTFDWAEGAVGAIVNEHGLQLGDLRRFVALRQELFEVDVRFGQLGSRDLFEALDARGVLDHKMPGVDRIDDAVDQPPKQGRARLRGETIREAAGTGRQCSCSWEYVFDHLTEAYLDLDDPFAERCVWRNNTPPFPDVVEGRAAPTERRRRRTPAPDATPRARSALSPPAMSEAVPPVFSRLVARLRGSRPTE